MSYVGQLLIAPPSINDEFWSKTVIFIYEQNIQNVLGLVLNKPGDKPVRDLLAHHNINYPGEELLNIGGPVNPNALVMLHSSNWLTSNTMMITPEINLSSDKMMLDRVGNFDQPDFWGMYMGICAWNNRQLDMEMRRGKYGWLVAEPKIEVIFDKNPERMWNSAIDLAAEKLTESYFSIQ
jgi:putative transcriptional regulator